MSDFIAVRLQTMQIEKDKLWPATEDHNPVASPRTENGSVNMLTNQVRPLDSSRRFYL
jgi:hypothetical protein